jgi:multiple antibiotic resistance protein
MLTEYLRSILEPLSILFWVVDPLVAIPIFIAITKGDSLDKKKVTALRASIAT